MEINEYIEPNLDVRSKKEFAVSEAGISFAPISVL
jgi:hypothetical protein